VWWHFASLRAGLFGVRTPILTRLSVPVRIGPDAHPFCCIIGRLRLKCDGTGEETRFRLSAKRTSPFESAGGASVQSTTGSRSVRIRGSNAGYIMFRGSVKGTGYPLHSPVSPSLRLPCVTVCHHISAGLYRLSDRGKRGTYVALTTHFLLAPRLAKGHSVPSWRLQSGIYFTRYMKS
jgi:hypothetical protein